MKKLKGILGVTTNVAVVVFAVVALGVLAKNHLAPRAAATQGGVLKGSTFPELAGADYKQARRTLVLTLNVDCRYCTKGFPFYNRLAEAQREHAGRFGLVAAFINKDEDRVKSYVEEKQLAVRMAAGVDLDKLGITTTPTVVLLDEGGKVIDDSDPAQSAALAGKVIESGAPGSFPEYLNELERRDPAAAASLFHAALSILGGGAVSTSSAGQTSRPTPCSPAAAAG